MAQGSLRLTHGFYFAEQKSEERRGSGKKKGEGKQETAGESEGGKETERVQPVHLSMKQSAQSSVHPG